MTEELLHALTRLETWMRQYMKSWYNEAEDIQQAIRMKEEHTARVRGYARELSNALAHTKHSNPDDIELTTIDDTVLPVTHPTGVPEDRKATVRSG